MAEQHYDVDLDLRSSKADENMLGFSVFTRTAGLQLAALEGMVKIAAFHRPDGSGYLTPEGTSTTISFLFRSAAALWTMDWAS